MSRARDLLGWFLLVLVLGLLAGGWVALDEWSKDQKCADLGQQIELPTKYEAGKCYVSDDGHWITQKRWEASNG